MKKYFAIVIVVGVLTITTTSFRASSHYEKDVSENIVALATPEKKLGQTCTMGCHGLDYFYVCVMCGIDPTSPCTFNFHAEGIGDRSTCGAED